MAHWSESYIGRPYRPGDADCAQLAVTVQEHVFHRQVTLPLPQRWAALRHDPQQLAADYGIHTNDPQEGDAVVMRCGRGWHLGVYTRIGVEEWVLHATSAAGAAHLTRLRDLPRQGLKVEGFYRWK